MGDSYPTRPLGERRGMVVKELISSSSILKTTALIGTTNMVSGSRRLIRMKAFIPQPGPRGMGLVGVCDSIITTTAALTGAGVSTSGVPQVAEAAGRDTYD